MSTLAISCSIVQSLNACPVTYTFRTVGQVLGVSLSGATVQGVLARQLREKITGPGSAEVRPLSFAEMQI